VDVLDQVLEANRRWVEGGPVHPAPAAPARHLAVVTCMDARLDPLVALGLARGQAHVVRNAGGVVTEDVLRSLAVSQRELGTRDVLVVQHTGCGLAGFDDELFRDRLEAESGQRPGWPDAGFTELDASLRTQVRVVATCPWLQPGGEVAGLAYQTDHGRLDLVVAPIPVRAGGV
jgi:carbonic anhydrase